MNSTTNSVTVASDVRYPGIEVATCEAVELAADTVDELYTLAIEGSALNGLTASQLRALRAVLNDSRVVALLDEQVAA
jgi:hypothetical protein